MKSQQTGIGAIQLLVVTATVAALSLVVKPEYGAITEDVTTEKDRVAKALSFAGESQRRIEQSFLDSHTLPRTATEAAAMKPPVDAKPEFVREVKFQHDFAGETVMIMAYLDDGVVDNILGGEQYVYIAGIKSHDGDGTIEWQCGARNVDLNLLPEDC